MPVKNPSAPYLCNMLRAEYIIINRQMNCSVKGVFLYREKEDLEVWNNNRVLAAYAIYDKRLGFYKRKQRKLIWKNLIYKSGDFKSRMIQTCLAEKITGIELKYIKEIIISRDIEISEDELNYFKESLEVSERITFNRFYNHE